MQHVDDSVRTGKPSLCDYPHTSECTLAAIQGDTALILYFRRRVGPIRNADTRDPFFAGEVRKCQFRYRKERYLSPSR